jgi:DNA-directed RNA polymerase subunit RPC12/RpoP
VKPRDIILLLVAVALIGGGVWYATSAFNRIEEESKDFPEGTFWVCADCQAEFQLPIEKVLEIKAAASGTDDPTAHMIPCPQCGSRNTLPGLKCPNCGRIFPRPGPGRPVCPYCKKPFPPLFKNAPGA